ncbi:hypothetical protein [Streptomyces sp. NRRL S-495]|uniref:hypothetical protein n=1 Tax=Streptomycetaceae TaxID=2062 RepID=UPI0005F90255|nr:hypothetical protein [Streptomyces sp. NRRL S-495]KJY34975.1 hypothetical protein VR45_15415 [Streptomyces sp. NRRL S-495]
MGASWEYKIIDVRVNGWHVDLSELNALGSQGWEAVSANRYVEKVGSSTEVVHREVLLKRAVRQVSP